MAGDAAHRGSNRRTGLQGRFVGHIRVYGGVHDGLRGLSGPSMAKYRAPRTSLIGGRLLHHRHTHRPFDAGWSSPVARQAHNLKVVGSNPTPATNFRPVDQAVTPGSPGFYMVTDAAGENLP